MARTRSSGYSYSIVILYTYTNGSFKNIFKIMIYVYIYVSSVMRRIEAEHIHAQIHKLNTTFRYRLDTSHIIRALYVCNVDYTDRVTLSQYKQIYIYIYYIDSRYANIKNRCILDIYIKYNKIGSP